MALLFSLRIDYMAQWSEALRVGRDAVLSCLGTTRALWTFWVPIGAVVAGMRLVHAFRHRSLVEVMSSLLIWLVVFPLFGKKFSAAPPRNR